MRRLTALLLAVVLPAALLAACSDADEDPIDPTSTDAGDAGSDDDTPLPERALSAADLGEGWIESRDPEDDTSEPECLRGIETGAIEELEVGFEFTGRPLAGVPTLGEIVLVYDDESSLLADFDAIEAGLESCDGFDLDVDGVSIDGEISRFDRFPTLGERAAVWRVDLTGGGFAFTSYLLLAYDGLTIVTLNYVDFAGARTVNEFGEIARAAVDKAA